MDVTSLDHSPEAVLRAFSHWDSRHKASAEESRAAGPRPAFTIALSREVGALGTSVAREIGRRLSWPVYDHELLELIAREANLRINLLESIDERRVSWLEECIEAFASARTISEGTYVRYLVETLLSLSAHGECIIVGRGAAQVLPMPTTLRVRLVAALEDRISVIARERSCTRDAAAKYIETTEQQRIAFVKDHFQKDPEDPEGYDLTLNASRYSVSECAVLVIEALRSLQVRAHTHPQAHA